MNVNLLPIAQLNWTEWIVSEFAFNLTYDYNN